MVTVTFTLSGFLLSPVNTPVIVGFALLLRLPLGQTKPRCRFARWSLYLAGLRLPPTVPAYRYVQHRCVRKNAFISCFFPSFSIINLSILISILHFISRYGLDDAKATCKGDPLDAFLPYISHKYKNKDGSEFFCLSAFRFFSTNVEELRYASSLLLMASVSC